MVHKYVQAHTMDLIRLKFNVNQFEPGNEWGALSGKEWGLSRGERELSLYCS